MWLWFDHIQENVKAFSIKKLVTDVYIEKTLKKWIKKCMKIENAHIKASNESVQLKDWHRILNKYNDYFSQKILVWLFKKVLKFHVMLSIIWDEILLYREKSVVWYNNLKQQK